MHVEYENTNYLALIPGINNHIPSKLWDEIRKFQLLYCFSEWLSHFFPHFMKDVTT